MTAYTNETLNRTREKTTKCVKHEHEGDNMGGSDQRDGAGDDIHEYYSMEIISSNPFVDFVIPSGHCSQRSPLCTRGARHSRQVDARDLRHLPVGV